MFGYFQDADLHYRGYIYKAGQFTQIDYPDARDTFPYYMNARGDLAGNWDTDPNTVGHGFVLTADGQWITFDAPGAPENSTMAIGINDRGQVLGVYLQSDGYHPFVTSGLGFAESDFTFFQMPGTGGFPETANSSGAFVGYYTQDGKIHGVIGTAIPQPKQ